jgi:hypothetical protein
MEFTVPQFIENEAKIVGPLTFKQSIYIGAGGGICFFLFFTAPFYVFAPLAIIVMAVAAGLAFLKVQSIPLPSYIKNFFFFLFKPKVYLWKKKNLPLKFFSQDKSTEKMKATEDRDGNNSPLKISKKSRLNELNTEIEAK